MLRVLKGSRVGFIRRMRFRAYGVYGLGFTWTLKRTYRLKDPYQQSIMRGRCYRLKVVLRVYGLGLIRTLK